MKELSVESRGVRIVLRQDLIKIEASQELVSRPLAIEVDYQGQRQTHAIWKNPWGPAFSIYPPAGLLIDLRQCDVRVKDGLFTLCEWKGGGQLIIQQCGWLPCVACRDSKLRPGQMWVGKERTGIDRWITCPECGGTGQVPQVRYIDPVTGLEIDYERQNEPLLIVP